MHEDDLRWVANCALFAAIFMLFAGVIFSELFTMDSRVYIKVATLFVTGIFAGFGVVIHIHVKRKIDSTTIYHLRRRK